jgi:hypothetical protein
MNIGRLVPPTRHQKKCGVVAINRVAYRSVRDCGTLIYATGFRNKIDKTFGLGSGLS